MTLADVVLEVVTQIENDIAQFAEGAGPPRSSDRLKGFLFTLKMAAQMDKSKPPPIHAPVIEEDPIIFHRRQIELAKAEFQNKLKSPSEQEQRMVELPDGTLYGVSGDMPIGAFIMMGTKKLQLVEGNKLVEVKKK